MSLGVLHYSLIFLQYQRLEAEAEGGMIPPTNGLLAWILPLGRFWKCPRQKEILGWEGK